MRQKRAELREGWREGKCSTGTTQNPLLCAVRWLKAPLWDPHGERQTAAIANLTGQQRRLRLREVKTLS